METKKLIKSLSIWGAVFAILASPLLHFVYGWSQNNIIVGLFAPVNESPWEHMKLVFTSLALFAFVDYSYLKGKVENYCFALAKQIGLGMAFILAVFYIYTPIVGHSILIVDISSFVVAVILAKYLGYKILTGSFKSWEFKGINTLSIVIMVLLAAFFVYATFNPPRVGLFLDEQTGAYGMDSN
jgi:hypothetical protein